jgi:hypothetical protein
MVAVVDGAEAIVLPAPPMSVRSTEASFSQSVTGLTTPRVVAGGVAGLVGVGVAGRTAVAAAAAGGEQGKADAGDNCSHEVSICC